mgnify:CR=1 FL=1
MVFRLQFGFFLGPVFRLLGGIADVQLNAGGTQGLRERFFLDDFEERVLGMAIEERDFDCPRDFFQQGAIGRIAFQFIALVGQGNIAFFAEPPTVGPDGLCFGAADDLLPAPDGFGAQAVFVCALLLLEAVRVCADVCIVFIAGLVGEPFRAGCAGAGVGRKVRVGLDVSIHARYC